MCAFRLIFFIKSLSLKADKLRGVNNVKVLKLFKISLYLQLLSFLLYHLISSDIIKSNLVRFGNAYENPGPNDCNLKFFHWNLDSLTARNNTKVSLIEAYNSVFNYDLIAVSDTRLNQSIDSEDMRIEGFSNKVFCNNHPSNSRVPGGVCIYHKENVPIKFDLFLDRLQLTVHRIKSLKPYCIVITSDFNCRTKQWWLGDIELPEGSALDEFIESNNLSQLIGEPTNIRTTGMSCIDLIITDQPNLFVDFGVHSSPDDHCQH